MKNAIICRRELNKLGISVQVCCSWVSDVWRSRMLNFDLTYVNYVLYFVNIETYYSRGNHEV